MEQEIYPDFVARSGQVNTPPGSYDTVKEWIRDGFINRDSNILEVGCTTGFIANQINRYTGARVTGVDISASAIEKARRNSGEISSLIFLETNAEQLPFENDYFSHVIIGGHLPWVKQEARKDQVIEATRVLKPNGFLLTSLYYFHTRPPEEFITLFNSTFNTAISSEGDYQSWSSLFDLENLVLENENNYKIICPDNARKMEYIKRFSEEFQGEWKKKVDLFSENGKYLSFFVKVFQKIGSSDPHIQIPRGGIYQWEKK